MKYRIEAKGGSVVIENGLIADDSTSVNHTFQLRVGELRPGLINAHDHLAFNHFPRLGKPPYRNAYDWGLDLHARWASEIALAKTLDQSTALLFGALKNILGGVTTVVHHDRWERDFDMDFPIRVAPVHNAHSLRFERDLARAFADAQAESAPICIHLAEGVDEEAAAEPMLLADAGLLNDRVISVHNVGVDAQGARVLADAGAAVVWCPTANDFLFGQTAPAELFATGIDVLLGTDSLLTGAGTMLDELRAARALALLDDEQLAEAVGKTAARRLRLPEPTLAPGANADVIVLAAPLLHASPVDVQLVIVGGQPRLAIPELAGVFDLCGVEYETLVVQGQKRLVSKPLKHAAELATALKPECGRILN